MTSKLVVNTIEADTGISSVSFASSISMSSTSKFHFGDAGIDIGADTNINRPTAGALGFNINSSEKVRITSAGNVGIGTAVPEAASNYANLSLADTTGGQIELKRLSDDTKHYIWGNQNLNIAGGYANGASSSIRFYVNGANERLRITSAGKVGINSTSPTYALEVDGGTQNTVIAARSSDAKAAISFLDNTSGGYGRATIGGEGDEVYITSGAGVERLRITSSGHLSIASSDITKTWSLGKALHIGNAENCIWGESGDGISMVQNAYYNSGYKKVSNDRSSLYTQYQGIHTWSTAAAASADSAVSFIESLRITTAGQLVMGATTSKAKFEIKDNGYTSTSALQRISADDDNPYALIIANDTLNTGTVSGLQFFVGNTGTHMIRARGSSTASNNNLQLVAQNDVIFNSGSSESTRARITSTGELGVNTSAPVEKLGISGNMRFVNPNGTTSRITALPSGSYNTGTTGGSAVCFQRFADGGGGSDEIFFETHWQGNRHGESMRINKYGHVIKPNQPSFYGRGYNGHNSGNWKFDAVASSNGEHNQGSHFNNNTGLFTCPVAGHYFIGGGWGYTASANYCMMGFRYNGNTQLNLWEDGRTSKGNYHISASLALVIQCNANDTLSFVSNNSYAEPNTNTIYAWGSIYLVG